MKNSIQNEQILLRLRRIRWIACLDFVLLVALLYCSYTGIRSGVKLLGPLHGGNFLVLLVMASTGALDGYWSWKYPAAICLSLGPLGAWFGERMIQHQLQLSSEQVK